MALVWEHFESMYRAPAGGKLQVSAMRAKVPGGWFVWLRYDTHISMTGPNPDVVSGIVFYPDPDHAWDGNSLG